MTATGIGALAIVLWSALALLTTLTGGIPPLQLTAMAFSVGALLGIPLGIRQGVRPRDLLALPAPVWLNGIGGLFGYHLLYFLALRNAPVVEANLVNYLWPLLLVLLSSVLPGEHLRRHHGLGTLLGFLGAALLVTGGRGLDPDLRHLGGYLCALTAAGIWAVYSVLSRRFDRVPTAAIGGFCAGTAVLAWAAHAVLENTVWPAGWQWLAVMAMGLGPLGAAFFLWDHGMKRGSIATLGALSYFAPLLSTLLLVAAGKAAATWTVAAACLLIIGGAVVAAGLVRRPVR